MSSDSKLSTPAVPAVPEGVETAGKTLVVTIRHDGTERKREMPFVHVIRAEQWAAFGLHGNLAAFLGFAAITVMIATSRGFESPWRSIVVEVLAGVCALFFVMVAIRARIMYVQRGIRNSDDTAHKERENKA